MEWNSPQGSLLQPGLLLLLLASAFESLWEVKEFLEDKEKSNKISFYSGNEDRMRNYRSVSFNFIL